MKTLSKLRAVRSTLVSLVLVLALVLFMGGSGRSTAQPLPTPTCAWPFLWTPVGLGNWIFPDTAYRLWYIPIDREWEEMTITGTFPETRFFSLALYDDAPVATALADHLFDAQIVPDPGSTNPFASDANAPDETQNYTVTVTRSQETGDNALRLNAETGWLLYRMYLPNAGAGGMGGVPLPAVAITDSRGETSPLPTCEYVNRRTELMEVQSRIVPELMETPPRTPPVPDRIWFGPIHNPPVALLPNPDNKYMVSFFMSEDQPERIIVIRVKMPGFPDTFRGAPVSQPAPGFESIQLRYWTMCVGQVVSPMPLTQCAVDATTPLDDEGFATIVITGDVIRPHWLAPDVVWLPYGDGQMVPKTIFLRYLLPSSDFPHSIQQAVDQGCGADYDFPTPPSHEAIAQAGQCTLDVMGDYYPAAAWCDSDTFIERGWKACLEEAGID